MKHKELMLNEQALPVCCLRIFSIHILCLFAVYCTCLLGSHAVPYAEEWNPDPLFSVNVTDIPNLISKKRYVACKYLMYESFHRSLVEK